MIQRFGNNCKLISWIMRIVACLSKHKAAHLLRTLAHTLHHDENFGAKAID